MSLSCRSYWGRPPSGTKKPRPKVDDRGSPLKGEEALNSGLSRGHIQPYYNTGPKWSRIHYKSATPLEPLRRASDIRSADVPSIRMDVPPSDPEKPRPPVRGFSFAHRARIDPLSTTLAHDPRLLCLVGGGGLMDKSQRVGRGLHRLGLFLAIAAFLGVAFLSAGPAGGRSTDARETCISAISASHQTF